MAIGLDGEGRNTIQLENVLQQRYSGELPLSQNNGR